MASYTYLEVKQQIIEMYLEVLHPKAPGNATWFRARVSIYISIKVGCKKKEHIFSKNPKNPFFENITAYHAVALLN